MLKSTGMRMKWLCWMSTLTRESLLRHSEGLSRARTKLKNRSMRMHSLTNSWNQTRNRSFVSTLLKALVAMVTNVNTCILKVCILATSTLVRKSKLTLKRMMRSAKSVWNLFLQMESSSECSMVVTMCSV